MISITDKSLCCGCSACEQICSKKAISMAEDEHGFRYPKTDSALCIGCNLCNSVCPSTQQLYSKEPYKVYAAKNCNTVIRKESSSGGIFTLFAEKVIKSGGVVFGAKFDENWNVVHGYTESIDDLHLFRGSKYIQSVIGDSYIKVRNFLKNGRIVLFTGTPCQILGLNSFLKEKYSNLITLEIFCHGVPSPGIWHEYLKDTLHNKGYNDISQAKISNISFRDKGLGWRQLRLVVKRRDDLYNSHNDYKHESTEIISQKAELNPFFSGFTNNVFLRPSCYSCMAKAGKSGADFAVADFWGVKKYCHSFSDNIGVSLVYISNKLAEPFLEGLSIELRELDANKYMLYNRTYVKSVQKSKYSDHFWEQYEKDGISAIYSLMSLLKPTMIQQMIYCIRKIAKRILMR